MWPGSQPATKLAWCLSTSFDIFCNNLMRGIWTLAPTFSLPRPMPSTNLRWAGSVSVDATKLFATATADDDLLIVLYSS